MDDKDNYTGPTLEQLDRSARMMDANIPPGSASRLEDMNPMPLPKPKKEKLSPKKMETKKPVAKKKGGKITAANYDKEYGKIYRKAVKKMCRGGGIEVRGKTRGKMV
jgi:hypothetical protein